MPRPLFGRVGSASSRDLYLRSQRLLASLELPDSFDVPLLLERIVERRGRPLRLLPLLPGLTDEPSGLWVPLPTEDVIFAESRVSRWYQDHVVLHEVGHMLYRHLGTFRDVTNWLGQYGVTRTGPTQVAMRCSVTAPQQEREAEMVALLIESRLSQRLRTPATCSSTPAEVASVLNRLALALGANTNGG